jgi:carbon-monoxide dehydrogenase medium subunit
MDIAIAGAALSVRREGDRVREARVALGAVAPTPLRVAEAEAVLVSHGLTDAAITRASELCMAAARPISDVRATAEYRREMVGTLVRRGLEALRDG